MVGTHLARQVVDRAYNVFFIKSNGMHSLSFSTKRLPQNPSQTIWLSVRQSECQAVSGIRQLMLSFQGLLTGGENPIRFHILCRVGF